MSTSQSSQAASQPEIAAPTAKWKTNLKWAASFGIPLAIALIPPTPVYTKVIINFFAITVWAMLSWVTGIMPEIVVGFLLPVLYIVAGVAAPQDAFSPWMGNVPWIVFGGIILGYVMMQTGLAKRIAFRAILLAGGTYKRTLFGMVLGGLVIAPIIPTVVGKIAIFAIIAISICQALNLEPKSQAASGVMMAAFMAVAGPKLSYLTSGADNPLAMGLVAKVTGSMISWAEYALHNAVIGILYTFMGLFIVYAVIKPEKEFDSVEVIKARCAELGPLSSDERKTALLLGAIFLLVVTDFWHKVDIGWIMVIGAGLAFAPGIGALKPDDLKKLNIMVVFFVAGAMCIGPIAAKIGVVKIMANLLLPLLKGTPLYTCMAVFGFAVVLKLFLTPMAATAMFITPITEIATQLGFHPYSLGYVFKYGIDQYIFPYEYAVLLYIYSFGYLTMGTLFKVLIPRIFLSAIFLAVIAYPYWKMWGLFGQ